MTSVGKLNSGTRAGDRDKGNSLSKSRLGKDISCFKGGLAENRHRD